MIALAVFFFMMVFVGAIIYKIFGTHEEGNATSTKFLKKLLRVLFSSIGTVFVHRAHERGLFTGIFLIGALMVGLSVGVIFAVTENHEISEMLTNSKLKGYVLVNGRGYGYLESR